jgi:hypothetical protein
MSIIKKGIKAIGKVVKKVVSFVKDYWKEIVVVGLSVFTAGLATVGFAGFSGAMAAAGGGFGGFMSAVGSTLYAGVGAIGATFGIGPGAQGTAAAWGGAEGASLFSGSHLAAALGSDTAAASIASQQAALMPAGMHGPAAALAGAATGPQAAVGNVASGAASQTLAGGAAAPPAAPATAKTGFFSGDLAKAALITTGGQMLSGYMQGKALEEDEPLAFWGVDLRSDEAQGKEDVDEEDRMYAELIPEPGAAYTPPQVATPYGPDVEAMNVAPVGPVQSYGPYTPPTQQHGLMDVSYRPPGAYA